MVASTNNFCVVTASGYLDIGPEERTIWEYQKWGATLEFNRILTHPLYGSD